MSQYLDGTAQRDFLEHDADSNTKKVLIHGSDGTDAYEVRTDTDGHLQVDVLSGGGGTQYTEGDVDATITGTAVLWEDAADTLRAVSAAKPLPISAASLPLPTGAATLAGQTQPGVDIGDVTVNNAAGAAAVNVQDGGNSITVDGADLAAAASSLNTIDDWDETDRCKVNLIVGSVGVTGGSGTVDAATQRVVLATNVGLPPSALVATTVGTDTEISVTSATTALLAANADRKRVWIQNHGVGFVRVRLAATALVTSPIRLVPQVGTYVLEATASGHIYRGVINAISEDATADLVGVIEETATT